MVPNLRKVLLAKMPRIAQFSSDQWNSDRDTGYRGLDSDTWTFIGYLLYPEEVETIASEVQDTDVPLYILGGYTMAAVGQDSFAVNPKLEKMISTCQRATGKDIDIMHLTAIIRGYLPHISEYWNTTLVNFVKIAFSQIQPDLLEWFIQNHPELAIQYQDQNTETLPINSNTLRRARRMLRLEAEGRLEFDHVYRTYLQILLGERVDSRLLNERILQIALFHVAHPQLTSIPGGIRVRPSAVIYDPVNYLRLQKNISRTERNILYTLFARGQVLELRGTKIFENIWNLMFR